MKNISLKNLNIKEVDQLGREQLKNVIDGFSGNGAGKYMCCSLGIASGIFSGCVQVKEG